MEGAAIKRLLNNSSGTLLVPYDLLRVPVCWSKGSQPWVGQELLQRGVRGRNTLLAEALIQAMDRPHPRQSCREGAGRETWLRGWVMAWLLEKGKGK